MNDHFRRTAVANDFLQTMASRLGLVCITHSQQVRFRTITRTRLLQHDEDRQRTLLAELYRDNLQRLDTALSYCADGGIALYRMPSSLFPFYDTGTGREAMAGLVDGVAQVGARASALKIRLVMHPDQFVVLNSESEKVVANSVTILQMHADIMDLLRQPRSPWALIEIHGGKSGRGRELVDAIARLPDAIRLRLGLENDEYAYSAEEIAEICMASGLPMVFDAHHHIVHEGLPDYEDPSVAAMLAKARATWADPAQQLVHISNGRSAFNDRSHADLIEVMPSAFNDAPWIEVEAKHKEEAIRKLRLASPAYA
jgi:UV DNA damage endonuclease